MIYLGCHVSMKAPDYLYGAIKEAVSYGANACMIYTGPPQNSKRVDTNKFKIKEARELMAENDIDPERVIVHAPYIINLANAVKSETADFGAKFLAEELRRTAAIGANVLVLHPGSHVKAGVETGTQFIVDRLNQILENDESDVVIALETMAGKGTEIGRTFEELKDIIDGCVKQDRIGVCLDTCHIHDAGYDVSDFDAVLEQFDDILGLSRLKVIHINDSKNVRGAHKDRHENIGKGHIGYEALHAVVHHPRLENITKILETPYIDDKPPYKEEITWLKEKA